MREGKNVRHRAAMLRLVGGVIDKRCSNHLCIVIRPMNGPRHRYTSSRGAPSKPFPFNVTYAKIIYNKNY